MYYMFYAKTRDEKKSLNLIIHTMISYSIQWNFKQSALWCVNVDELFALDLVHLNACL